MTLSAKCLLVCMVSGQLSPVSWVEVGVKVGVRVEVRVRVRVPNLNPKRMYATRGKCPRGVSVLEPVSIDTLLCRSVSIANLSPILSFEKYTFYLNPFLD